MAVMADAVPTTLGALVGATTFAAGFLSTRVHRERQRALTAAKEADDAVDYAARAGVAVDPALLQSQAKALDEAANDQLNNLAVALVAVLALAVLSIVVATASSTPVAWFSADGRLLLTFAGVALVVLVVSLVDVLVSRSEVSRRRAGTTVAMMQLADRAWTDQGGIGGGKKPSADDLAESREAAENAVRAGRGIYGPAWQVLANAHLASLSDPSMFRSDEWVRAAAALDRAADLGIDTAPFRAARAYAREIGPEPDFDEAACEWVRAMWLHHEATRPLSYTDIVVEAHGARQWQAGTTARNKGALADPATWRFRPQHPQTLSMALTQIPALFVEAGVTAQLLATSTVTHPDMAGEGARSAVAWLEDRRRKLGSLSRPLLAENARELLQASAAPAWRVAIEAYLGPDGPIQAAERHEREMEQRQQLKQQERRAEADAAGREYLERAQAFEQASLQREAEAEEDRERGERIDRGEATVEDVEAEEAMLQDVICAADEHARRPEERMEGDRQWSEQLQQWLEEREQQDEANALWQEEFNASTDKLTRSTQGRATPDEVAENLKGMRDRPWAEPIPPPSPFLPRE